MRNPAPWLGILAVFALAGRAGAVGGVIEISPAGAAAGGVTAGDTPGFPVTISESGSYRLTGSLVTFSRATIFVDITAPRVTLDLNGFTIGACVGGAACGTGTTGIGIRSASDVTYVTVRNGTVTGTGSHCVILGSRSRVESLHAVGCGQTGIIVGSSSQVVDTNASDNGDTGIYLSTGSLLRDSVVSSNGGYGLLLVNEGSLVVNTVIRANDGAILASGSGGIRASGYRECILADNDPNGAEVQPIVSQAAGQVLNLGNNVCGTDTSCP
jgi:hypothetical protein